jgi:hypothetical protein
MSAKTPAKTAAEVFDEDEEIFNASEFDLPVPKLDGLRGTKLDIRFSGSGSLDRTSEDDLALLEAARLVREVRLIVTGKIATKTFALGKGDDDELSFACTVRVASVEAGEIA